MQEAALWILFRFIVLVYSLLGTRGLFIRFSIFIAYFVPLFIFRRLCLNDIVSENSKQTKIKFGLTNASIFSMRCPSVNIWLFNGCNIWIVAQ